jgi:uncharacterized protein YjbI with pentapeptide repeats
VLKSLIAKFRSRPIPEEVIRAKAQEIWKAQGSKTDDANANWQAAIAQLESERVLSRRNFLLELVRLIITSLSTTATIFGGIVLFLNFSQGENRLITERFTRSIEQLGSKEETIRIGGIYALERIANDSPRDRLTIVEVLSSFIRGKQAIKSQDYQQLSGISTDAQAALTVIKRRKIDSSDTDKVVDLSGANLKSCNLLKANLDRVKLNRSILINGDLRQAKLTGANLSDTDLTKANLTQANLDRVNLMQASLTAANLTNAKLHQANLNKADLSDALLDGCQFQQASLSSANLMGAVCIQADFRKANFSKSNLSRVDFSGANLDLVNFTDTNINKTDFRHAKNITIEQMKQADNWYLALFDPEFDRQLRGLG